MNAIFLLTVFVFGTPSCIPGAGESPYSVRVVAPGASAESAGLFILLGPEGQFRTPGRRNAALEDNELAELIKNQSMSRKENCKVVQIYLIDEEQTSVTMLVRGVNTIVRLTKADKVVIYLNLKGVR